jgi:stage V sporulation protein SpoVS
VNVRVPDTILFSLFGFRIFGRQDRPAPAIPSHFSVARHADSRTVALSWNAVPDAVGYNIRFGLAPQKLYQNYIVYDHTSININSLLARHDYWFAIDSFNEGGITNGSAIASTGPYVSAVFNQATHDLALSRGFLNSSRVAEWRTITQGLTLGPQLDLAPATFANFPALAKVDANASALAAIPASAFANATNLTTVILPSSLQSIGASAFANAVKLRALILPNQFHTLGASAFSGAVGLVNLTFGARLTGWGNDAFGGTGHVTRVEFTGTDPSNVNCIVLGAALAPSAVVVAPHADVRVHSLCGHPIIGRLPTPSPTPGKPIPLKAWEIVLIAIGGLAIVAVAVCLIWRRCLKRDDGLPPNDSLLDSNPTKTLY